MLFKNTTILLIITVISFVFVGVVLAQNTDTQPTGDDEVIDLRREIEEKTKELENLEEQKAELEAKLRETGEKKNSLQNELNSINWRINQLEVSMRSNRLTIEKLELERKSLNNDIKSIEEEMRNKKDTVGKLLVELQQRDNENMLVVLLKSDTLSESVSHIQSIMTLGDNLTKNVKKLRNLQTELVQKSNQVKQKKINMEIEQQTLENRQELISDQKQEKQYLLAQTKNQEQTYEQKIAELEEQQKEISNVMSAIEEKLRLTLDSSLLPQARPGLLAIPVKSDSCITQEYGRTEFAARAYKTGFHKGTDFRAPAGDPIFASMDGTVAVVDNNDFGPYKSQRRQYGKYIIIEHDNNLSTLYAHLSSQDVQEGQEVEQGDIIGHSGNTGYSTAAHLHFGVYATPTLGWQKSYSEDKARESGGLIEIRGSDGNLLAAGLVPVGATLNPGDYLPSFASCY